jgi:hypothetical protein
MARLFGLGSIMQQVICVQVSRVLPHIEQGGPTMKKRRTNPFLLTAMIAALVLSGRPDMLFAAAPVAPKQLSPEGSISDGTISFSWKPLAGATHYQLWVQDPLKPKVSYVYTAQQAGCASGGVCTVTVTPGMARGICLWKIKAKNADGWGSFSPVMQFTLSGEVRIPISYAPFTIKTPGSYYLTRDLYADGDGIVVKADDVTIDLNGYRLIRGGVPGAPTGISMDCRSNVEIRNGVIEGFGYGVHESSYTVPSYPGRNHRVINVRVMNSVYEGIYLTGSGHLVKDCIAARSGWNYGIYVGAGSTVEGNIVYGNGQDGVVADPGSIVRNNVAYGNGGQSGGSGIVAKEGCVVIDNAVYQNFYYGIDIWWGNVLIDRNAAYDNNKAAGSYTNIKACASCTNGLNHAP